MFCLEEGLTNRDYQSWNLADIFLKVKRSVLSLKGTQLTAFTAKDKSLSFQAKIRILEDLHLSLRV